MRYWDASALVPLLVEEQTTRQMQALMSDDAVALVWWGTAVECASAVSRLERDGQLNDQAVETAFARLRHLADAWNEVEPGDAVREAAIRFLRVHALRAADALQLGAAFVAAEGRPTTLEVVTLDDRLGAAARKEGFVVTAFKSTQ
jgi:predicted nucleic acid-binding protein